MPLDSVRRQARLSGVRQRLAEAGAETLFVSTPHNIEYLTGFRGTAGVLVVSPGAAVLVVDSRYLVAARQAVAGDESVKTVLSPDIDAAAAETVGGLAGGAVAVEAMTLSVARYQRLVRRLAEQGRQVVTSERLIESLRMVKDAGEQAVLREAGRRLAAVARSAVRMPRAGRREDEVAAEIDAAIKAAGFSGPAFETIVASGPNGALPHARPGSRVMQPGDGVVLDFGGVYDGYCVDLTRTVQLHPESDRFQSLHAAVAAAQRAALAMIAPGRTSVEIDAAARDTLEAAGLAEAFGHATGHGLGLDVHEEPRIGPPQDGRAPVVLAAGMIFTVEPGAYLEGFGGVRIEDDVLVTPEGCEVLTGGA